MKPENPYGKCEICNEQLFGGSHYHCGKCKSKDVTGMYGHFSSFCRILKEETSIFHHCGPYEDCNLGFLLDSQS